MKVVIIEDEVLAVERLKTLLKQCHSEVVVLAELDTVKGAVQWFQSHGKPDLVFMDIKLADGLSFEIFDAVYIDYPVIFITAYQEYAINAFKVNSIDYLLKPISKEDLNQALTRYQARAELTQPFLSDDVINRVRQLLLADYKKRFTVKVGEHIKSLTVDQIAYFYSQAKGTYLHTIDNRNYLVDYSLEALVEQLDPRYFFRINRQYIIHHMAIEDIIAYSQSRLKLKLKYCTDDKILISRDRVPLFKEWLEQ
jgi:DNA-binding LytR/AlgR family response regulator